MAINIKSKSLGKILIQSGYGTPSHSAPNGTEFTNIVTGFKYLNNNTTGTDNWVSLNDIEIQRETSTSKTAQEIAGNGTLFTFDVLFKTRDVAFTVISSVETQVELDGEYEISYSINGEGTTNTRKTTAVVVQINTNDVLKTLSTGYERNTSTKQVTLSLAPVSVNLVSGDKIRMYAYGPGSTSGVSEVPGASWLKLKYKG